MKQVAVAVIGFGHLGRWHVQKADQLENANLIAIVESSTEGQKKAKEHYPHVEVVADVKDIITEIDAAIIVTPTSTHFELCKYLLSEKKHVFCEKPLCSTYEEAKTLSIDDQILQVGHSERCHMIWDKVRPKFEKLPSPKTIKISRYAAFKGRATDVDVVQDLMIHDLDLLLYLFPGKPEKVKSIGHKIRTDKWDHVTSIFTYKNGDIAILTVGRNHVKEERSLEVMSAHGCEFVNLFSNQYLEANDSNFGKGEFVKVEEYQKRDHLLIEQEQFYHSILNNQKPVVDYHAGKQAVYYVDMVNRSLSEQKEVQLDQ